MSFSSKTTEVVDITGDEDVVVNVSYKMELEGVPKSQARPRLGRNGFFYNPRNKDMAAFKARIKSRVRNVPIFGCNVPIVVKVKFFFMRPNTHFRGKNRLNPLKTGLSFAHVGTPDIDNLAKFVLDGMNELVYQDDSQVVKLIVYKIYNSEGGCDGRTVVKVTRFDEKVDL